MVPYLTVLKLKIKLKGDAIPASMDGGRRMATAKHAIPVDDNVARYLAKPRQLLIGGEWVKAASGKTFPTYNPATGEVLAHRAEGDKDDIYRPLAASHAPL